MADYNVANFAFLGPFCHGGNIKFETFKTKVFNNRLNTEKD